MTKRALLAATNYTGTSNALRGCVSDATRRRDTLILHCGFLEKNIVMLLGPDATAPNIISVMRQFKTDARDNDETYGLWSGHGSQIPDKRDKDGLGEIICCDNFDWTSKTMITDKQIAKWLSGIRGRVFLTPDSCNSGDLTKGIVPADIKSKFLLNPELQGRTFSKLHKIFAPVNVSLQAELSGCQDYQTSADIVNAEGIPCGAFSDAFEYVIRASKYKITYVELHRQITARLIKQRFQQRPQLDCSAAMSTMNVFGV